MNQESKENPMSNEKPVTAADIKAAALKVFTYDELAQMPKPLRSSICHLIGKRLAKDGPPPTVAELEGIKELVLGHLWHPAFDAVPRRTGGV